MKGKVHMPASRHVQTAELAQEEKEKAELDNTLSREREDKEKMIETIATLQSRLTELQNTWHTHSCTPTTASPETSPLAEKLNAARAANDILEKQTSTAKQRITDLENIVAENSIKIETLQKEVEQEKKTRADQQKTIADLKSRMKGNLTLSEVRGMIWSDIISVVME